MAAKIIKLKRLNKNLKIFTNILYGKIRNDKVSFITNQDNHPRLHLGYLLIK